jgi:hypothetical protein
MRTLLAIMALLISAAGVNAQGIEYFISDQVSDSLGVMVESVPDADRCGLFIVVYQREGQGGLATLHSLEGLGSNVSHMVESSGRFMMIGRVARPVLSGADLKYGVVRNRSGDPVRTSILDGYGSVEFDRFGRLIVGG